MSLHSFVWVLIRYIGVDEKDDVQLFYYFVESERNPRDDPLLLWLTGGPTCSALSGLAFEIGSSTVTRKLVIFRNQNHHLSI